MSKLDKPYRKAAELLDDSFKRIVSLVLIVVFVVGSYMAYDTYYILYVASRQSGRIYKPTTINEDTLKDLSKDAVAWIVIDNTTIDYPIMQGDDNTEYLNKDPYGEYSLTGSIFLDFRNDPYFRDAYSVIYGHHMSGGLMFGALDAFAEESWFESHRTGTLYAGSYVYRLESVGFLIADGGDDEIFDAQFDGDRMPFIMERIQHYHPEAMSDRLLAVTTCRRADHTDRTILLFGIFDTNG